jgi:hypothetical protein
MRFHIVQVFLNRVAAHPVLAKIAVLQCSSQVWRA